jgi:hypothetical protein
MFISKPKKYGLNIAVVTGLQDGIMGLLNLGCVLTARSIAWQNCKAATMCR